MKLIIIGERHDWVDGPLLLKQTIDAIESEGKKIKIFWEVSSEQNMFCLWAHGTREERIKREQILVPIWDRYKHASIYANSMEASEFMRELKITKALFEVSRETNQDTILLLLIGAGHSFSMLNLLKTYAAEYSTIDDVELHYPVKLLNNHPLSLDVKHSLEAFYSQLPQKGKIFTYYNPQDTSSKSITFFLSPTDAIASYEVKAVVDSIAASWPSPYSASPK